MSCHLFSDTHFFFLALITQRLLPIAKRKHSSLPGEIRFLCKTKLGLEESTRENYGKLHPAQKEIWLS